MKTFLYLGASLAFVLAGCSANFTNSDRVRSSFHETVPVAAVQRIRISNVSGQVAVYSWNRSALQIDAVLHAADVDSIRRLHVDVATEGGTMRIATRYGDSKFFNIGTNNNGYIDYTIHMPAGLSLNVANVSGAVSVDGIRGDIGVQNVSGSVEVAGARSALNIYTTSGDIRAATLFLKPGATVHLGTVSGSATLVVPKNAAAAVKASSLSGRFASNFPVQSQERTVGSRVEDRINGGGSATIVFSTVSGAMTLTGK